MHQPSGQVYLLDGMEESSLAGGWRSLDVRDIAGFIPRKRRAWVWLFQWSESHKIVIGPRGFCPLAPRTESYDTRMQKLMD